MSRKKGPGKYHDWITEEGLSKIEEWARKGLTDEQISHNMGIHPSTLYDWQNRFPELTEALKRGKEVVDQAVENALLKRALGYEYEEKTYERIWNPTLEKYIKVNTKTVIKQVLPDTTAQIFWLKNRKPNEWRDKKDLDVSVNKSLEDFFGDGQ